MCKKSWRGLIGPIGFAINLFSHKWVFYPHEDGLKQAFRHLTIGAALLLFGNLLKEAQECCNKDMKHFRGERSRNFSIYVHFKGDHDNYFIDLNYCRGWQPTKIFLDYCR